MNQEQRKFVINEIKNEANKARRVLQEDKNKQEKLYYSQRSKLINTKLINGDFKVIDKNNTPQQDSKHETYYINNDYRLLVEELEVDRTYVKDIDSKLTLINNLQNETIKEIMLGDSAEAKAALESFSKELAKLNVD